MIKVSQAKFVHIWQLDTGMIYAALYFITEPNVKFFLKLLFIKGSVERVVEQY